LDVGSTSIHQPQDMPYGERGSGVTDPFGNMWYIATANGPRHVPEGLHTLNAYLHPHRADPLIAFMRRAVGGEELAKYAAPEGSVTGPFTTRGSGSAMRSSRWAKPTGRISRRRRGSISTCRTSTRPTSGPSTPARPRSHRQRISRTASASGA